MLRDEAEHMRPRLTTVALPIGPCVMRRSNSSSTGSGLSSPFCSSARWWSEDRSHLRPAPLIAGGATAYEGMGNVAPNGSLPLNLPRGGQRQTPLRERRTQMSKYISKNPAGVGSLLPAAKRAADLRKRGSGRLAGDG